MKLSGKMRLMIVLKVTKNHGFALFLENTFFEKLQGGVKLSEKMLLMIILKVTGKQGFTLFLENTFLEKPQGGQFATIPQAFLGLKFYKFNKN